MDEPRKTRRQTPRVPSNLMYERIVPIALIVMTLVLLAVIVIAIVGFVNAIR